jgi:hypothetical protein
MKKNIVCTIVAIVLFSGVGAIAVSESDSDILEQTEAITFSPLQLIEIDDGTCVTLPETTSFTSTPGGYELPIVTKVFTFPFKTTITAVDVIFSERQEIVVTKPIRVVPAPIADSDDYQISMSSEPLSSLVYPEQSFSYHLGAGLQGNHQATYLAVHLYPVQYNSVEKKLSYAENAQIKISYVLHDSQPAPLTDQYDLVIIAPKKFASALEPLVDHKISKGLTTKIVTINDISKSTYFPVQGRDSAEEMKYFIKNAFDQWGIKYALLVGGRQGGIYQEKWWLPVRYSNLDDGGEGTYLTDLYFADLYDVGGNFSSWDSNDNGVFAEWTGMKKDVLDMYPEIGVGRLACINLREVKLMVDRIITYENSAYGSDWFKRFVGVAGDTYPAGNDPYYEGEMATNASFDQIQGLGFEASFMWTSNNQFNGPTSVIDEISKGCGFVHFSGHGNPHVWGNHPPRNESFVYGPNSFELRKLTNKDQLPIVIVGGCHNQQFNTSLYNMVKGVLEDGFHYFSSKSPYGAFWYNEWIPRSWGWSMASAPSGGCIAIMANTGYGYGEPGENTLTQLGRHLEWLFFKSYSDGNDMLGVTHGQELVYYMNEHSPMVDQIDCKIVQQWALLGDPSLKIGGYST